MRFSTKTLCLEKKGRETDTTEKLVKVQRDEVLVTISLWCKDQGSTVAENKAF